MSGANPFSRRRDICGSGTPRCTMAPSPRTPNPLGLCSEHLAAYPGAEPPCPACASPLDLTEPYTHVAGGVCFVCSRWCSSGHPAGAAKLVSAREEMRHRLHMLLINVRREAAAGTLDAWLTTVATVGAPPLLAPGKEITALLARCPADIAERARPAFVAGGWRP